MSSASSSSSATAASTRVTPGENDQLALQILDAILRGDFNAATAHFDSLLKQTLPPEALASSWAKYQQSFGNYQSHGNPQDTSAGGFPIVNIPLQMERKPGEFRVVFDRMISDPDATVSELDFLEAGAPVPDM